MIGKTGWIMRENGRIHHHFGWFITEKGRIRHHFTSIFTRRRSPMADTAPKSIKKGRIDKEFVLF
ncbi:hypothetical protein [Rossellomorea aquimaris]|uniref:hypothetical protein n=1 Tax=Rossellomorea aquimaris TaxID=189382 RepID=UPI00115890F0|nr:hypothetical protein [Rossellomorea aquimaris]